VGATSPSYDSNGNLTTGLGTFTYDSQNRLLTAVMGLTTDDFYYDIRWKCSQDSPSALQT